MAGDDLAFERIEIDPARHVLHFGPYASPKVAVGQNVECARLGPVKVVAWSKGKIRWPIGKSGRSRSLVLFEGLADAVRSEAGPAVMEAWGFGQSTLWTFRKALGASYHTEGLRRLRASKPHLKAMQRKAVAKGRDPERRAKIAEARRGKPRPPHVVEALRKANLGRKHTPEQSAKMSAIRKRLGFRPPKAARPWSAEEDQILRTQPIADVVRLTGRSYSAVQSRRHVLDLPDRRKTRGRVLG